MIRMLVESNRPAAERERFRELVESEFGKVLGAVGGEADGIGRGIHCDPSKSLTCTYNPNVPGTNDTPSCD